VRRCEGPAGGHPGDTAGRAATGVGSVGEFGWSGAAKTYYWVDPVEAVVGLFMAQYMLGPAAPDRTFRSVVYQAID
jgi:CubicO group peptidase (beta-lactamase class C family)